MPVRLRQFATMFSRSGLVRSKVHRFTQRAGRMYHRPIDAGGIHFRQHFFDRIGIRLAMVRAHAPVLPDVDL
jgi:hypothetical protein